MQARDDHRLVIDLRIQLKESLDELAVQQFQAVEAASELERCRASRTELQLALEDAEQEAASGQAASEQKNPPERKARAARRRTNRGALPAHLPRIERVVDVRSTVCPCCAGALHRIGEDVSERLDSQPAIR